MKRLLSLAIVALCISAAMAAEPVDSLLNVPTIADHLNAGKNIKITQPDKLNNRLRTVSTDLTKSSADEQPRTDGGFRILVFSGNNPRTAQAEATRRQQLLNEQFPEYAAYVSYDAPYWRLKVGDFRKYDDATGALGRLKAAMPAYAREMRIVRERINL